MLSTAILLLKSSLFLSLHLSGNMSSFPKPLSGEEEQKYLEQWAQGDLEARNILIERNMRLVAHIIKKYYTQSVEQDDLISIGTIGLIKGISSYKPEKNVRLATYAARCIENEVLMYLRSRRKSSRDISLYEPIGTDREGNEIQLFDIIESDADDAHERAVLKDDVRLLYSRIESVLSPREQRVLKMRYGLYNEDEYTQREIARVLGISRSYVSRIEKSAIEKLRDSF